MFPHFKLFSSYSSSITPGNDFESIQVPTTALMTTDKIESTTATEVTADDMFVDDFYVVI